MKKYILSLICLTGFVNFIFAQTLTNRTVLTKKTKADSLKQVTLKQTPVHTINNSKPPATSAATPPATTNSTQDLPDLRILELTVMAAGTQVVNGETKPILEISFTIVNQGNVPVVASTVGLQGWIGYNQTNPKALAACGIALSSYATEILKPGDKKSGTFRCSAVFNTANNPFYTLDVDAPRTINELNEQNNSFQVAIRL
jgi:hypothetical protein